MHSLLLCACVVFYGQTVQATLWGTFARLLAAQNDGDQQEGAPSASNRGEVDTCPLCRHLRGLDQAPRAIGSQRSANNSWDDSESDSELVVHSAQADASAGVCVRQLIDQLEKMGKPERERYFLGLRKRTNPRVIALANQVQAQISAGNLDAESRKRLQEFVDEKGGYGEHSAACTSVANYCAYSGLTALALAAACAGYSDERANASGQHSDAKSGNARAGDMRGGAYVGAADAASTEAQMALGVSCCCLTCAVALRGANLRSASCPTLEQALASMPPSVLQMQPASELFPVMSDVVGGDGADTV